MFSRLMALNQEAFDNRWFDVAYHALAAALHAAEQEAEKEHGAAKLNQVETTATTQAAWIDAHAREYHHSTMSTQRRNHSTENTSIYTTLARQAHARQVILKSPRR